jgi:uncharacterized protein
VSAVVGPRSGRRWEFLDALRGFALCGILLVNIPDLVHLGSAAGGVGGSDPVLSFYELWVQGRFVPIFAFLFGLSASLLYAASLKRIAIGSSRWSMVRRFALLLVIGIVHGLLLYPGEILTSYAIVSLLFLIPAMFLPRRTVLIAGLILLVAAYAFLGNSPLAIPGLMLTGWAAAQYGLPGVLERGGRRVAAVFLVAAAVGVTLTLWQNTFPGDPRGVAPGGELVVQVGGFAGLALAVAYTTGLSLLWQTPIRGTLSALFRPLGKMALTNYVGASLIAVLLIIVVDFPTMTNTFWLPVISISILVAQVALSAMWLRFFRYGPLEWAWRLGTRWAGVPMRNQPVANTAAHCSPLDRGEGLTG